MVREGPRCVVDVKPWTVSTGGPVIDDDTVWHSLSLYGIGCRQRVRPANVHMADVAVDLPFPLRYVVSALSNTRLAHGWVCLDLVVTRCLPGKCGKFWSIRTSPERLVSVHPRDDPMFDARVALCLGGGLPVFEFELKDGGPPLLLFSEETCSTPCAGRLLAPPPLTSGADLFVHVGRPFRLA